MIVQRKKVSYLLALHPLHKSFTATAVNFSVAWLLCGNSGRPTYQFHGSM